MGRFKLDAVSRPDAALEMRASDLLARLVGEATGETIPLRVIADAFAERTYGLLLIILGLISALPVPGSGTVAGGPLLLVAGQLAIGLHRPWLPRWLLNKEIDRRAFARAIEKAMPTLKKVEAICRPRLVGLFAFRIERLLGLFMCLLALSVLIPLPGSNLLPALSVVLMSIALIEEDGFVLVAGIALGLVGIAVTGLIGGAVIGAAWIAAARMIGF